MGDSFGKPETRVEGRVYPFHGYAPGGYIGMTCCDCAERFGGDKRAWRCEECAEKAAAAAEEPTELMKAVEAVISRGYDGNELSDREIELARKFAAGWPPSWLEAWPSAVERGIEFFVTDEGDGPDFAILFDDRGVMTLHGEGWSSDLLLHLAKFVKENDCA